ncbi:Crp/Fnr family transcriptional regulator, partial [Clostridium sp.]|uniref:Crp/Fnr family transcriptional regulator n=1 Tax=Clostridium sp. TaxID=1506 RepID=UPI003F3559C0
KSGDLIGGVPYHLLNRPNTCFTSRQDLSQFYTKTRCKIYRISSTKLNNLLISNPEISFFITQSIASHFHSVINHFHSSKEDHTPARLCKLLINLAQYKQDKYFLHKYFTYVELAKYLGVHSVTISRIMLTLKNMSVIEKEGHCIIISDMEKLINLANSPHLLTPSPLKDTAMTSSKK